MATPDAEPQKGDRLSHLDDAGRARMVDVGDKPISRRLAVAAGRVIMRAETLTLIEQGLHHKGDVVGTARLAGIMAAKRTADLIPLCHALALDVVDLDVRLDPHGPAVDIRATCAVNGRTGVEMEALTAVSIAALTIYGHVQGGRPHHAGDRHSITAQRRRPIGTLFRHLNRHGNMRHDDDPAVTIALDVSWELN